MGSGIEPNLPETYAGMSMPLETCSTSSTVNSKSLGSPTEVGIDTVRDSLNAFAMNHINLNY